MNELQAFTTQQISNYVVAYVGQQFVLSQQETNALVDATNKGNRIVVFRDKVLSTSYLWIAPQNEVKKAELNSKELALAEKIAEWISRPANASGWKYENALSYSKELILDKGFDKSLKTWNEFANGAYPSVTKFLQASKR